MNITMTRREFAALAGAVVLSSPASAQTGELIARAIPGSGERLPAVGLGTAYVFDRNDETTRQKAAAVVQALVAGGGSLIDTSSAYGDAEAVLGEVIAAASAGWSRRFDRLWRCRARPPQLARRSLEWRGRCADAGEESTTAPASAANSRRVMVMFILGFPWRRRPPTSAARCSCARPSLADRTSQAAATDQATIFVRVSGRAPARLVEDPSIQRIGEQ